MEDNKGRKLDLRNRIQDKSTFRDRCEEISKKYDHTFVYNSTLGFLSGLLVFLLHLIRLECIVSISLSIALTIFIYNETKDDVNFDGSSMSWILLTFAVVSPQSSSIRMAFTRREDALRHLKTLRSTFVQLYLAHSSWDWTARHKPETGRIVSADIDWKEYASDTMDDILLLIEELRLFLLLPTSTRAIHKVTRIGKREASEINVLRREIHESMVQRIGIFTAKCEFLKLHGLPGNEASRIRQWEQFILDAIEGLRIVKEYRTPQALRSYSRLLSVIVPPFFAPYYADLARSTNSLVLAIIYASFTALALTGLFECVAQLEDPFVGCATLDGINVQKELGESLGISLSMLRNQVFTADSLGDKEKYTHSIGKLSVSGNNS